MERLGAKAFVAALGDWTGAMAPDGGPAPSMTLQQRLSASIAQAVAGGLLRPGVVLPAERTIARTLGVSRSTVTASLGELKAMGILIARHGSGTVVAGAPDPAQRHQATMLPGLLGHWDGTIDLAASSPGDVGALPTVEVDLAAIVQSGPQHGYTPAGLPVLRHAVANRFSLDHLPTDADEILITNGAQHALALAFSELARPGDAIIVDEPTYPGVIDLLAAQRLRPVPLARRRGGIDADELRSVIAASGATLAYLQPLVHNPTGLCGDEVDLRRLASVLASTDITVVEDLVLADLRFDSSRPISLAARLDGAHIAAAHRGQSRSPLGPRTPSRAKVIVVGSVSKLGWGGLRIGWLRAEQALIERLVRTRLSSDLGSSVPSQLISASVLSQFDVIAQSRQRVLARRAERLRSLLAEAIPQWEVTEPAGGLSLWITLPPQSPSAEALAQRAATEGVMIATGAAASSANVADAHIRLCFDRPDAQLEEGIRRLERAWSTLSS